MLSWRSATDSLVLFVLKTLLLSLYGCQTLSLMTVFHLFTSLNRERFRSHLQVRAEYTQRYLNTIVLLIRKNLTKVYKAA